jgi:hypothetical protein
VARIVVITHRHDQFLHAPSNGRTLASSHMLAAILQEMIARGHSVTIGRGPDHLPAADLAIMHVNTTVVAPEYREAAARYPRCINIGAVDISKRRVSGAQLRRGDDWAGPVIIKSNLNYMGRPEARQNARAALAGQRPPYPGTVAMAEYQITDAIGDVPDAVWDDPNRVVDRFIPEIEPDGFAVRAWIFLGDSERCTRYVSTERVIKAQTTFRRQRVPVPKALRAERERLGFDYGKFDFVVHQGKAILLDANKTPGGAAQIAAHVAAGNRHLADGLAKMIPRTRPFWPAANLDRRR